MSDLGSLFMRSGTAPHPLPPQLPRGRAGAVRELSDEEVFGSLPRGNPLELSDAEVFGTVAPSRSLVPPARPSVAVQPAEAATPSRFLLNAAEGFRGTAAGEARERVISGQTSGFAAAAAERAVAEAEAAGSAVGLERFHGAAAGPDGASPYAGMPLDRLRQMAAQAREGEARRQQEYQASVLPQRRAEEAALPGWNSGTLFDRAVQGATALAGQFAGGALSPESLVGPAGANAARRGAERLVPYLTRQAMESGAPNAVAAASVDPVVQMGEVSRGAREAYSPADTALAAALGGVIGTGLPVSVEGVRAARGWMQARGAQQPTAADALPPAGADLWANRDLAAVAQANGIQPGDPRIVRLAEVLQQRRAAEADPQAAALQQRLDAGAPPRPTAEGGDRAAAAEAQRLFEEAQIRDLQQAQPGPTRPQLVPATEPRPVLPTGEVLAPGAQPAVDAAREARAGYGPSNGALVPVEPQPTRMTPAEIARAQAEATAGRVSAAEPPPILYGDRQTGQPRSADQLLPRRPTGTLPPPDAPGGRPGEPPSSIPPRAPEPAQQAPARPQEAAAATEVGQPVRQEPRAAEPAPAPREEPAARTADQVVDTPDPRRVEFETALRRAENQRARAEAEVAALQEARRVWPERQTGGTPAHLKAAEYLTLDRLDRAIGTQQRAQQAAEGRGKVAQTALDRLSTGEPPAFRATYGADRQANAPAQRTPPQPPKSLIQRVRELGGIRDVQRAGGNVTGGGDYRNMNLPAGVINNVRGGKGRSPDMMAQALRDEGYLRPDADEVALYEAMREEAAGRRQYKPGDAADYGEASRQFEADQAQLQDIGRSLGLDPDELHALSRGQVDDILRDIRSQDDMLAAVKAADDEAMVALRDDGFSDAEIARFQEDLDAYFRELQDNAGGEGRPARDGNGGEDPADAGGPPPVQRDAGEAGAGNRDAAGSEQAGADGQRAAAEPSPAGREPGGQEVTARDPLLRTEEADGQRVMPGMEASTKQAVQARAEAPMRGKGPQRGTEDFALFDPKARDQLTMPEADTGAKAAKAADDFDPARELSANAVFNPSAWRWMFGGAAKYAGPFRDAVADFREAHRNTAADKTPTGAPGSDPASAGRRFQAQGRAMVNAAVGSADAEMRAVADGLPTKSREALNSYLDRWFVRSGQARGAGRAYDSAVDAEGNRAVNRLQSIMGDAKPDVLEAAVKQVRSGTPGAGAAGDIARGLQAWLKEMRDYQVRAGVELGDVKKGYFPRSIDAEAVWRNRDGFLRAAEAAYRDSGVPAAEAKPAAKAWLDTILSGGSVDNALPIPAAGLDARHVSGRTLTGGKVDALLAPFLHSDPRQVLTSYAAQAIRRAEFVRRMGGNDQPVWNALVTQLRADKADAAIQQVRSYTGTVTGASRGMDAFGRNFSSWARTMTALGTLEKATFASLPEVLMPAVRSGNVADAYGSVVSTMRDLFAKTSKDGKRLRELSEDLGAIVNAHAGALNAARWAGGEVSGKAQAHVLERFFRRTGLEAWTRATRVAAVDTGDVFLRRMVKDASGGGDSYHAQKARFALSELGVQRGQIADLGKLLNSAKGGMDAATLRGADAATADLYRTALLRFVDQSIMRPSAATRPKWAAHPLGAMVFQLNSYAWALHENVLMRPLRIAFGDKGNQAGMSRAHALIMGGQMLMATSLMAAAGFAMVPLRDAVFGDAQKVEEKRRRNAAYGALDLRNEFFLGSLSRSGMLGRFDPLVNMFMGVKYGRDVVSSLLGPGLGMMGSAAQTALETINRNSDRTNSAERKVARAVYDMGLEPAANYLMAALPMPIGAVATQLVGHGASREAWTTYWAGREQNQRRVAR